MARRGNKADKKDEAAAEAKVLVTTRDGRQLYCGVCGLPQWKSPGGATCDGGHGEAPSVFDNEAIAIRELAKKEEVKEVSGALAQALDEPPPRDPTDWRGPNSPKESPLDPAFERIAQTLVVDDPEATYKRLMQLLAVGENRGDYGTVMRHLDEAETNARLAHQLWQSAIIERKRWEMNNEVVFAAARGEALKDLEHDKKAGYRTKQITDADVEAQVAKAFPDEWRAQELRRVRARAMVDSLQNLAEIWASRCRSLQTMLSKQR